MLFYVSLTCLFFFLPFRTDSRFNRGANTLFDRQQGPIKALMAPENSIPAPPSLIQNTMPPPPWAANTAATHPGQANMSAPPPGWCIINVNFREKTK